MRCDSEREVTVGHVSMANVGHLRICSSCVGKERLVCRSALSDFNSIMQLLGGPTEKSRAEQLLKTVTIVEDTMSSRAANLKLKGKIKERSKVRS